MPLYVQCGAVWCKCGLCGAKRACAMAEPCSHGSVLVRARQNMPASDRLEACCIYLCLGWCCVPLWAHSTTTCTFACAQRLGRGGCVLPRPGARERAAIASRGGLASERVPGELGGLTHHFILHLGFFPKPLVHSVVPPKAFRGP